MERHSRLLNSVFSCPLAGRNLHRKKVSRTAKGSWKGFKKVSTDEWKWRTWPLEPNALTDPFAHTTSCSRAHKLTETQLFLILILWGGCGIHLTLLKFSSCRANVHTKMWLVAKKKMLSWVFQSAFQNHHTKDEHLLTPDCYLLLCRFTKYILIFHLQELQETKEQHHSGASACLQNFILNHDTVLCFLLSVRPSLYTTPSPHKLCSF